MALSMLVEGSSMRATAQTLGVSFNTIKDLMLRAGKVCCQYHDETTVGIKSNRIQCDEMWVFCYAKRER